ncbi:unnamed protein product [Psylliodes chrysocephalus]|uniref:Multidrug resistance-associated protein lethal(2)03659 n=1 Tax=Psylliodes chrysocephalus TaxID=3402493 RepID=A0A9P0GCX7_9CUCU|nr:unnamed protein product [Psylliodes chrysocephala]
MDHCQRVKRNTNPKETANIFSLLSFAYIGDILKKGFKKDLEEDDLYEVIRCCNSTRCGGKLEKCWDKEKERKQNKGKPLSISKILWKRWGKRYILFGFTEFTWQSINNLLKPYALSNLIAYFVPGSTISRNEAYFYAVILILLDITNTIFMHNYILWGQIFGTEIKTAFSSLLYRKALRLAPGSDVSLGNIVTLITKDVMSFRLSIWVFNDCWIIIMQVIIISTVLYIRIGIASFAGIGIMILALPIQVYITKWVTRLRLDTSKKTDERLQLTQEILSTMRIIKMYTWEEFFTKKINNARRKEVIKLVVGYYLKIVTVLIGLLFSKLGFFLLIMACIWTGITTDTTIIIFAVATFKDLEHWLSEALPYTMGQLGEFFSAYQRIIKTLEAEELDPERQLDQPTNEPLIELKNASVRIKDQNILSNISFKITSGLTLITGTVGSGKTSLFKAILQDYPLSAGSLVTDGRIAYASQDPWLFPSSIKQNILFGEAFNEKRYNEVIRVCALLFDFNQLENGDETIVTDRGLNLSKGQQSRINLARAVYRESEIYLLDDCLTALDAAVQDYIFTECIQTFLKEKICILISQTASHIGEADNVIIMDKGFIKDIGKPDEHIFQEVKELVVEDDDLEKEVIVDEKEINEKTKLTETEQLTSKKKVYSEVKKEGSIDFIVYKKYFMYGGGIMVVLLIFFMGGGTQFTASYSDKLLTNWIDIKQTVINIEANVTSNNSFNNNLEVTVKEENFIFRKYTIFLFVSIILELVKHYALLDFSRRASINIHKAMIKKIMNGVMHFFDTHLIGNVLNRFSQDMVNTDENLPFVVEECFSVFFNVAGGILLIISINLTFIIYVVFMCSILILVRWYYLPSGRSLKRLEASTRSPMIGHLNATLEGLTTIRSCNVEHLLIQEFDKHQDLYSSAYLMSLSTMRGIGFFMSLISSSFLVVVLAKFMLFDSDITAGEVALALTQVLAVCRQMQWGVRQWAELENLMTSVERLLEYTDIKTENKQGLQLENWPCKGSITYEKVSLSYNDSDELVLKNLNFEVKPNEKIGIVGRTGAGKSSIISTIFRLYEVQGKILIDGVDIKTLAIQFLRKHVAIIPQDPIVFSGTIRTNLDVRNEFNDNELWEALEKVGMKNYISSLDQIVGSSSNTNFSSGQKQLICLARAILRKHKIVVMDEATANMDHETDIILHQIIKNNFSDATVLTIAHRLHAVLECDKVMVLDRGEIAEFNDPNTLLDNRDGMFYNMVKQAGLLNYLS